MTLRLSGQFSTFCLVFFVLKSLLGIARQWSLDKFAILTLKPRSHVRILIYRTWAIVFHFPTDPDVFAKLTWPSVLVFKLANKQRTQLKAILLNVILRT